MIPDSNVMSHTENYNAHEAHTSCKSLSENTMSVIIPLRNGAVVETLAVDSSA